MVTYTVSDAMYHKTSSYITGTRDPTTGPTTAKNTIHPYTINIIVQHIMYEK